MIDRVSHDRRPVSGRTTRWIKGLALASVCLATCGCPRQYWRKQADDLSYNMIRDKQSDPRWAVDRVRVETDPRSRFFDPYDPDFAPLPPDDLAAHEFMHWAYGKRGWKHWHEFGDAQAVESPCWLEPFGMSQEVVESNMGRPAHLPDVKLTLEDAIDLSYIHSRDYQTQIENLYLAALALSLQRFAFDVQFVGLNGAPGQRPSAALTATDIPSTSDSVNLNPTVGVSQLLPSGAQFIAELANNTLWLFASGDHSSTTASTLSYSLTQPLLANGGRRFIMENLTQAERNVLYAARDLARYRMGFFTSTVAGGFTAGIASGVPGVFTGGPTIPTVVPTFANGNGGFLGLLQLNQQVANAEYNIRQLRDQLDRLRAQAAERPDKFTEPLATLPAGLVFPPSVARRIEYDDEENVLVLRGQLTDLEVRMLLELSPDLAYRKAVVDLADRSNVLTTNQNIAQLETQLAGQINGLRQSRVTYLNGIDSYKLQLGLPVDMPVTIDLALLKPFELVDQRLGRLQDRLNAFVLEPPPVRSDHPDAEAMARVAALVARLSSRDEPELAVLRGLVDEMLVIRDDLKRDGVDVTESDFQRATKHRQLKALGPQFDTGLGGQSDPKRDERLKATLLAEFHEAEAKLLDLKAKLDKPDAGATERKEALDDLADLREDFLKISQSLSVVQINLRVDLIDLNPFEMAMEDAVAFALANRLDLMNARATVMDNRRKVEVAANQLQAGLNVVAAGNINTKGLGDGNNNPFDFRGDQSNFKVGLSFSTPLQLVAQRNTYRAAIIGYNQARRNYMRTEDQVKLDIRTNWRSLDINRRNFETLREQVKAATAQLDIAAEQTAAPAGAAPAAPAAGGGGGGGGGGANQAQGLQIINAVNSVLTSQNNLIQFWVSYEAFRLDMYNFMGTLEIDREGYWTDEFYQARARAHRASPNRMYPPLDGPSGYGPPGDGQELNDATYASQSASPAPRSKSPFVFTEEPAGRIRLAAGDDAAKGSGGVKQAAGSGRQGAARGADSAGSDRGRARVAR